MPWIKEITDKYVNLVDMADYKWSKLDNLKVTLAEVSIQMKNQALQVQSL